MDLGKTGSSVAMETRQAAGTTLIGNTSDTLGSA